jgi:hypothetical protein
MGALLAASILATTRPERRWRPLGRVGVDLDDVGRTLEVAGVASFAKSYDDLLASLDAKRHELRATQVG